MKINMETAFLDFDGEPLKRKNKKDESIDATMRWACIEALCGSYAGEDLSGEEKHLRYKLALKCSGPDVDLTLEDRTKLKELIGKAFGPLVVGSAYALLEGNE
jgi:hypothetical protein